MTSHCSDTWRQSVYAAWFCCCPSRFRQVVRIPTGQSCYSYHRIQTDGCGRLTELSSCIVRHVSRWTRRCNDACIEMRFVTVWPLSLFLSAYVWISVCASHEGLTSLIALFACKVTKYAHCPVKECLCRVVLIVRYFILPLVKRTCLSCAMCIQTNIMNS